MRLLLVLAFLSLCSCAVRDKATPRQAPTSSFFTASDGKQLSLRHWNRQAHPETIIIALHGIEGAARDFGNLGKNLSKQAPSTTLYALNLRGGGYDPSPKNRGDISSPELWKRDLLELHQTLSQRHPRARTIWLGESMGSLIAFHAASQSIAEPDGLVLVSPVVSLQAIPRWQIRTLKTAAFLAPSARVSLASLAGGNFQATTNSDHFQQSETNPYHVEKYTLRYLRSLATLSESMQETAAETRVPTLILHGGKDFLTNTQRIREFANAFPQRPRVHEFEQSHHLLFYDRQRDEVISSILNWSRNSPI